MAYSTKCETTVQWNPVNTVINGPRKFGGNNEVTVLLNEGFFTRKGMVVLPVSQKKRQ